MVGFLRGILLGSLVAAGGLVAVSQIAGPVAGPEPMAGLGPDSVAVSEPSLQTTSATDGAQTASEPAATQSDASQGANIATPAVDPTGPADALGSDSAVIPAPDAAEGLAAPSIAPQVSADAPTAPASATLTDAPNAPKSDDALAPVTAVVEPPAPGLEGDVPASAAASPAEPPAQPPTTAPEGGQDTAISGSVTETTVPAAMDAAAPEAPAISVPAAPGAEAAPKVADEPPVAAAAEEALLQPEAEAEPGTPTPGTPATEAPPSDGGVMAEAPPPPGLDTPDPDMTAKILPVTPDAAATLAPTPGLSDAVPGVVTGRLPRIGDPEPSEPTDVVETPPSVAADAADLPPLQRFARDFAGADGKPLFAILLEDTGLDTVDRQKLAALAMPLTIVIDPLSPGAADRAAIWRAGGQEVVMAATGIPAGAKATDLEQTFQALAEILPEAVAVIDPDGTAFQDNRPLATQVVPILAGQGRGLVTFDRGLNAADQVARRDGLGAATIFRRLDGAGEDAPVVRRYLDRAAFKAAQDGRVTVIGTLRPQTVAAILEWAVEGKSASVTLAPVSALMARP